MMETMPIWQYDQETLERYANVLLWSLGFARKKALRKSDFIQVRYDLPGLPLAEMVVQRLHENGQIPLPVAEPTARMQRDRLLHANNKRLTLETPGERELLGALAGSIRIMAPQSLTHLQGVDPEQSDIAQRGRKPLENLLHHREQTGDYAWTIGVYPSLGAAEISGMSVEDYARQIELSCMLERGDPVMEWIQLRRTLQTLTDALNAMPMSGLRVQSENIDLLLSLGEHRRWVCFTGRNMPSFEIYTSPDWRGTEGRYHADLPCHRYGHRISGLSLDFRQGEAVTIQATEGLIPAREQLRLDPGANKPGEFSLVDKRFSPIKTYMANALYDENFGGEHGSCHLAMGQSYANTFSADQPLTMEAARGLGFNYSSLHWDLVNTEPKEVHALLRGGGKELIYTGGQFIL